MIWWTSAFKGLRRFHRRVKPAPSCKNPVFPPSLSHMHSPIYKTYHRRKHLAFFLHTACTCGISSFQTGCKSTRSNFYLRICLPELNGGSSVCKFGARLLGGGVSEMVQKKMCERLEKQLPDQNSCGKKILALAPNSSNEE